MIIGIHPIRELLRFAPEKILRVYTTMNKESPLLEECEKRGIPISYVKSELLTKMAGSDSHQMFVAHIRSRTFLTPKQFLETAKTPCLVLMLDQIFDPQNFGALIRCAECMGASAVVWSKNRGADLTPAAAKASCGASELLPMIRLSNLATAIDQFKEGGFEVVASLLDKQAESAFDFEYSPKTLLIVGSEGEGIQPLLKKKSDRSVFIPMKGKIDSLNVAQAASVLLALWRTRPR